jgi:dTDP-4-dehydrorhamnose reductase
MKILVLGTSGMLGSAIFRYLTINTVEHKVYGTIRSDSWRKWFPNTAAKKLFSGVDANNEFDLIKILDTIRPEVVINCIGVIKQLDNSKNPLSVLPLNALLPHKLYQLCSLANARLIHISTDCVFNGEHGDYLETDTPNASDLYGISKHLGEVCGPGAVTLRTSIIGHELGSALSLIDWFLEQAVAVKGFRNAYFSGLPTNEIAKIIAELVITNENLSGLYHVAAKRISKFDLLTIVKREYGHNIELIDSYDLKIDRSLNADRFNAATGYNSPEWPTLIAEMHNFKRHFNL